MINFKKIEGNFRPTEDGKCAEARGGMVATAFPEATRAGVEMLNKGGNAVDAACAAAFALAVCEPQASGLGGQTMALINLKGQSIGIDGSSRAPSLARVSALDKYSIRTGYRATTVPSTPAVLSYMLFRYGTLKLKDVLEPAIKIANEGYRITELQSLLQKREIDRFLEVPSRSGAKYFLKNGKAPYEPGELFIQRDLAQLLGTLKSKGIKEFYLGKVARCIDADMRENGGLLRYEDLARIPWPLERLPIKRKYRSLTVQTLPPPAAGQTLLMVLLMFEYIPREILVERSERSYQIIAEVFRRSFRERTERPYDPNFYPQVQKKRMLQRSYAKKIVTSIIESVDPTMPILETADEVAQGETTHLSVMDKEGNCVSLTQSIERVYGSKAAAEGMGFLYNNYMMDFEREDPSHPYYLFPNAVPWATVAPTIIFHRKKPWMVLGSPGSERIFSTISQFLLHVLDESIDIGEAMRRPRLHCSLGGRISLEGDRFPKEIIEGLRRKGYRLDIRKPYSFYLGAIHAVLRKHDGEGFQGVAEIRRDGTAGGPE